MSSAIATAPQPVVLVDVDDLEDGDLAARIDEVCSATAATPLRAVRAASADRPAEPKAVVASWTVVRDRRTAVHAHRLGARAAALVA